MMETNYLEIYYYLEAERDSYGYERSGNNEHRVLFDKDIPTTEEIMSSLKKMIESWQHTQVKKLTIQKILKVKKTIERELIYQSELPENGIEINLGDMEDNGE